MFTIIKRLSSGFRHGYERISALLLTPLVLIPLFRALDDRTSPGRRKISIGDVLAFREFLKTRTTMITGFSSALVIFPTYSVITII